MAILEHFLFDSDYTADKIPFAQTGSYKITGTPSFIPRYLYINTHCNTMIFPEGDYTLDDSDEVYPMIWGRSSPRIIAISFMYNGECWIGILTYATQSSSIGKTVNYRIWGYYGEKQAKNTDIKPTANTTGRRLVLDSDHNYPRFISDGSIIPGQTYTHSLGYIPFTKTWCHFSETGLPSPSGSGDIRTEYYTVEQVAYFGDASSDVYASQIVHITDKDIKTYEGDEDIIDIYYRIYQL